MGVWKKMLGAALLTVGLFALNHCGGSPHGASEKYYLVSANVKVPYWRPAEAGLNQAAAQLKVKAEFVGPDTYDPKAQQEELRRLINMEPKPAGIMVSPADPELMKGEIEAALGAGIPVITVDSDSPTSKRLLFVGTNNFQAGVMGGEIAVKKMQEKGNVVVYTMPGQANLDERLQGYKSVFASYPNIKIAEIVDIKGDPRIAFDTTLEIADKRLDQVDAFICLEATAGKEVAEVLNRKGAQAKTIVAMDTDEGTLKWVKEGMIAATIAQKPFTMAYYGVKILDDLHHNPPASLTAPLALNPAAQLPVFVDTGTFVVDKNNVDTLMQSQQAARLQ